MSRNGSGTYNLPAGNPVITGSTISSTWANSTLSDIASALTGSIASDGQTVPSANLPMDSYIHTGVGDATLVDEYAAAGQVQNSQFTYLTGITGSDTIIATASLGMNQYYEGQRFSFIPVDNNSGPATLNINGIGAKDIYINGSPLQAGDILGLEVAEVFYDGFRFQLLNSKQVISEVVYGMIIIWHGTLLDVPEGWYVCDGTNGTPDLSASFVTDGVDSYPYIMKA